MAHIEKKRKTSGWGLACEAVGIGLCMTGIGLIPGAALTVYGYGLSKKRLCSKCGKNIKDKDLKMCPMCKEMLS